MTEDSLSISSSTDLQDQTLREPVAIVGIGCIMPSAPDTGELWNLVRNGRKVPFNAPPAHRYPSMSSTADTLLRSWHGAFFEELEDDFKHFRIPPIYRKSVSQMMLLQLRVTESCLRDAGYPDKPLPTNDTDIYSGTCFCFDSTLNNALKIEGMRLAYEAPAGRPGASEEDLNTIRTRLRDHFGQSSHDRVGEMASSIPARIASQFGIHGRAMALESADTTGYAVLEAALLALSGGQTQAALAVTGQRFDSLVPALALEKKGFSADFPLAEGATALLLKKLRNARRDGDRIYSVIRGFSGARKDSPSGLRYAGDPALKYQAAQEACHQAGIAPTQQQYIECALPGHTGERKALLSALADLHNSDNSSPHLGSSVANLGYSFANAGLNALATASLALHHRYLPGLPAAESAAVIERQGFSGDLRHSRPWPQMNERIAGVCGGGLNGLNWHIILSNQEAATETELDREPATPAQPEPIAIVGVGGAFGPWSNVDEVREGLREGYDAIQRLPESLLPREAFFSTDVSRPLSCYAEYGAPVKQREFDLSPYKLFPRRAATMDITQKLALQCASEALSDYGFHQKQEQPQKTAVILASNLSLERERNLAASLHSPQIQELFSGSPLEGYFSDSIKTRALKSEDVDHFTLDGFSASATAALISNCFQLSASAMAVEAACASSLAALHSAVQALRNHRYSLVLAGGVELPVNIRDLTLCSAQMMLSPRKIAPFALDPDGFSPGDGAGIFVLKRLSDALRDGDRVYSTITGIGASCDAGSMTAPDPEGQALAMRRAFNQAGYSPALVEYVEAHGTGTRIGDVAELDALNQIYGVEGRNSSLRIGSIKSNIGPNPDA